MKVGFYKAGKPIFFNKNTEDHSAISIEVTRIIRMFAERGHLVYIMSDTDYIPGSIKNVFDGALGPLDKVFVYNGVGLTIDTMIDLTAYTSNINLIVTDLSLLPSDDIMVLFKNVYSQSKQFHTYGAIQEHECYQFKPEKYEKIVDLYFGGTERGRTKDFFEYVHRPEVKWFGKSQTLDVKNYIPYDEHLNWMKAAKYSIVIGDESYNKIGFVTPRYYECIRYGVIPFVDMKYDPDEIMIKKNDFRRVNNYMEVLQKIKQLENDLYLYASIIVSQEQEITENMINGQNIIDILL